MSETSRSADHYEARAKHLQWSKDRAIEILDSGDPSGAVASMSSDLGKEPEMFNSTMVTMLTMTVMMEKDPEVIRRWIDGFN